MRDNDIIGENIELSEKYGGTMKILICDDEELAVDEIKKVCTACIEDAEINAEIIGVTDPTDLINYRGDLLILDIEMKDISGIDIKNTLDKQEDGPMIIFATNHVDVIHQAFGRNVIGFLEKPVGKVELNTLLCYAVEMTQMTKKIVVKKDQVINTSKVTHIRINNIYSSLYLSDGRIIDNIRKSLIEWEELLEENWFIRVNASTLINCQYIYKLCPDEILLQHSDLKFTVSRRKSKECKEKYLRFCSKVAKYV